MYCKNIHQAFSECPLAVSCSSPSRFASASFWIVRLQQDSHFFIWHPGDRKDPTDSEFRNVSARRRGDVAQARAQRVIVSAPSCAQFACEPSTFCATKTCRQGLH